MKKSCLLSNQSFIILRALLSSSCSGAHLTLEYRGRLDLLLYQYRHTSLVVRTVSPCMVITALIHAFKAEPDKS